MQLTDALNTIANRQSLSAEETHKIFRQIMSGHASSEQIAGILMALRTKGETADEITGAAQAMRDASTKVTVNVANVVDTCGTGGSGAKKLFNISTAAAFVVAAGGAHVAKHGNRGVSSKSGSADVLEKAGVNLDHTPVEVARCINEVGIGFLFAQTHHTAMRHAGPIRQALGVRTIFNMLGPLTNPAGAKRQVIGVFSPNVQPLLAKACQELGSEHILVIHADGLDEFSVSGSTHVYEMKQGKIFDYEVHPSDFGLETHNVEGLKAETADQSLRLVRHALTQDENPAARDLVALNAGAGLYVAGIASDLKHGVALAIDLISTGQAKEKLKELIDFSRAIKSL